VTEDSMKDSQKGRPVSGRPFISRQALNDRRRGI
jgi:hypothetical protein